MWPVLPSATPLNSTLTVRRRRSSSRLGGRSRGVLCIAREYGLRSAPRVGELLETAERVREAHLLWRPRVDTEEGRGSNDDRDAPRTRRGDVEAVATEEEAHPARRELGRRRRHRVDADGRLLALELVDGPDPGRLRQAPLDLADLGVVGRDDENVVPAEHLPLAAAVAPFGAPDERAGEVCDRVSFIGRGVVRGGGRDRHLAGTGPVEDRPGRDQVLDREMRFGLEPVVVEDLRREVAQVGMEPPGALEEQALRRWHRRRAAEEVRKRGTLGARWMRALERLVELLRVAEQDEAGTRARHGDDVGERDLPRLVDEQDVHRADHLRRRPQPRRPGGEVRLTGIESAPDVGRVLPPDDARILEDLDDLAALDRSNIHAFALSRVKDRREHVADHLVARSGGPPARSTRQPRAEHPRACARRPGTSPPLARE